MMLQFSIGVATVEDSMLSRCLQNYLLTTTAWLPFPMNLMFSALEALEE